MSNNEKRGFRLPWGGERGPEDGVATATLEPLDPTNDTGDEPSAGPFRLAPTAPEAAMIDSEASTTEFAKAPPAVDADAPTGWPTTDNRTAAAAIAADRPAIRVNGAARSTRPNPLVAGLVKAMREAAVASRAETTARLQAEASARVETIRGRATTDTADLKKRADDDVAEIREWSKAELARVRQVTDDRIEARKTELTGEIERHAATVERLVGQVETTVSAFEAEMDEFFAQLLAENDPARLAGLAERAPEPPDLSDEAASAMEMAADAADDGAVDHTWDVPDGVAESPEQEAPVEPVAAPAADAAAEPEPAREPETRVALHSDAAAEAEAEASEGLDPRAIEAWPTVAPSAHRAEPAAAAPSDANGPDSTRLFVHGLTSVAQISSFKGGLAAVRGVKSVSVSSGERGVFIFTVNHDAGVDLDSGVAGLTAFSARVTDATDEGFTVSVGEGGK
jgi:hypothetical protein